MGVDFYSCNSCGDTFPDCGDYVRCECGNKWCDYDCAEADGFEQDICKLGYDCDKNNCNKDCCDCDNFLERSCNYCREEDFEDWELLEYSLTLLNKTRDELVNDYKNIKE